MRLRSVIEKIHYANLQNNISDLGYKTYSGRIRGGHHFGIDLPIEGTISSFDIQIQGNQYRHKVNFSLEDKAKLGDLERVCDSIKEKTCLYHFNLEDNPILEKSSSYEGTTKEKEMKKLRDRISIIFGKYSEEKPENRYVFVNLI